jgi:hypothetical protein
MKKLSLLFAFLFGATALFAAGTVTTTLQPLGTSGIEVLTWNWTGDVSNGSVPASSAAGLLAQAQLQGFRVVQVEFIPGSPSPTNNYSATITDTNGLDILAGQAASALSSSAAQGYLPSSATAMPINGVLTLNITGNSVASAKGLVVAYIAPPALARLGGSSGAGSGNVNFEYNGSASGLGASATLNLVPNASGWSCSVSFPGGVATYTCGNDGTLQTLAGAQAGTALSVIATGASSGTLVAATTPALLSYTNNQAFQLQISDGPSHGGDTLNLSSVGAIAIFKMVGTTATAIAAGDIQQDKPTVLRYTTCGIGCSGGSGGSAGFLFTPDGIPNLPTPGTSVTLAGSSEIYVCTGACTVTVPLPVAGVQYCILNDDNVSSIITLAALGGSGQYENTARTAYGTAGSGTLTSGGAVGDRICIVARDTTHYLSVSYNGTWTAY